MHTQLMSGHLPALLHPNPKRAFVIGLGSGITVGALTQHGLERIDVAEMEPAVVEASAFFAAHNRQALSHPTVRLTVSDGRNFLLKTAERYDIIVSEPSNPWIGGIATLFTVEFFELAKRHLLPEGVMVQWLQGYAMSPEDFRMVAASFCMVFPHATLWATIEGDYLLVATPGPLAVDLDRIRAVYARSPALRADMKQVKLASPEALLSDFYLSEQELARLTVGAPVNTDDRLPLEFSAPRNLYRDTIGPNYRALRAVKTSRLPPLRGAQADDLARPQTLVDLAIGYLTKNMREEATGMLDDALARDPAFVPALVLRAWVYRQANRIPDAIRDLDAALHRHPTDAAIYHELGLLHLQADNLAQAIAALQRATDLVPNNARYSADLIEAYRTLQTRQPVPIGLAPSQNNPN